MRSYHQIAAPMGVSKSLPRLREDAKRWLIIPRGLVRIVIIISMGLTEVTFEKCQLAPLTLAIRAIPTQQPYSVQEVYVQPNHIVGAPLSLLFVAIYDRPPRPGEHDIPLNASGFLEITKMLF